MLALYFGDWAYWESYDGDSTFGGQKCTFDGPNKQIIVNVGVTTLDIRIDVYSGWKEWVKDPNHTNSGYLPAVSSTGGDPIPGTTDFTGDTYFLINGWRLIVDVSQVAVSGVLFSSTEATAYFDKDLNPIFPARVAALVNTVSIAAATLPQDVWEYTTRTLTETNSVAPTSAEVAAAVWDKPIAEHQVQGTFGSDLATAADIQASSSTTYLIPVSGTIVNGTSNSGSTANINVRDNNFWTIGEDGTTGLNVELTFNIANTNQRSGVFNIFGNYDGGGSSHYIQLWAFNVESAQWELLHDVFMPKGSTDAEYSHAYFEQHINRETSEVRIRLIHNDTNYSDTHELRIDSATLSVVEVITAADVATAVWDTPASDHQIVGSTGEALTAPASVVVGPETAAAISDAVWNKLLVDMVTAGTAGEKMNAMLTVNKYLALQK